LQKLKNINFGSIFFFYFLVGLLVCFLFGFYLDIPDDPYLRYFLIHGDIRTHIMSVPLGKIVSFLYVNFPEVDWLSYLFVIYIATIMALYSYFVASVEDAYLKGILVAIGVYLLLYLLTRMSIATITLSLVAVSIPLMRKNLTLFLLFFLMATLLREEVIIVAIPFVLVLFFIFYKKREVKKSKIGASVILIALIVLTILMPNFDKEYKDWLQFNSARAYFVDFRAPDKQNILNKNEIMVANSWYIQDEALISSSKLIEAAGGLKDILIYKIKNLSLKQFLRIVLGNITVIIIIIAIIYYFYKTKKISVLMLYSIFAGGFFLLLLIRNVDRVTMPLVYIWFISVFILFLASRSISTKTRSLFATLFLLGVIFDFYLGFRVHTQDKVVLRDEMYSLMRKHQNFLFDPSLGFPQKIDMSFVDAVQQNKLFDEKNWITEYILPAGWMSRHPLFYKVHNISHNDWNGKYDSYYEFLISDNSAFIGSKNIDKKRVDKFLSFYDKKFCSDKKCKHDILVIDQSKNFAIVKVIRKEF